MNEDPLVKEFQDLIERLGREVSDEVVSKASGRMISALKASIDQLEQKVARAEGAARRTKSHVGSMEAAARSANKAAKQASDASRSLNQSVDHALALLQSTTNASVVQLQTAMNDAEDGLLRKYDSVRRTLVIFTVINIGVVVGALLWLSTRL